MHSRLLIAVALCTVTTATVPAVRVAPSGRQPSEVSAVADERARGLLALADAARAAALQALSPAELTETSDALAALADRWRLAGRNADALTAARVAVECAERASDDRALARALSRLGSVTNARGEFAESLDVLQRSIALSRQLDDRPTLAEALGTLSYARFIRGDTEASLAASTESLTIRRELGAPADIAAALNFVAMAERQRGHYDAAVERYEEAVALAERAGAELQLARSLNNMAVAERERGNNNRAAELFERSQAINERLGNRAGAANSQSNLGMVYQDLGRNDLALDAFLKSLAITDAIGDRVNSANTLGNLGFLYRAQGDDTLALGYYSRALELYEQLGHTTGIARILDFRARLHTSRGEYAAAEPLYQRARQLRQSTGDQAGLANVELEIGALRQAQGDLDGALAQYQRGITMLDAAGERRSLSYGLMRLANVRQLRGEYREALEAATRATEACLETGQEARIWATELAAGRAWRGLQDREQARAAFERSIARIEALRDSAAGLEEDRERAFENQTDPYREMVALLVEAGQPDRALTFAERAKGRVLLDVLRHGRVDVNRVMTPAERAEERRLNAFIAEAAQRWQRVRRGPSDRAAADAERGLRDARIRAEAFRTSVYTAHPELRGQRSEAPAVGAPELAALVTDENAALVEFAVTPEATFVFVVTAGEPVATTVHRLALSPDALQRLAADYVSALEGRDLGFRTAGRAVSRALLAPIESRLRGLTRLIVVPDGPVWDLPFQALMLADGRFVVERFAVTYATSLTALREQRARAVRQDVRPRSVAAFGDPQIPRGTAAGRNAIRADELAPLPAAAREVRALGRLYGTASRVWVGPDATEGRFKGEAGAYSIVHVATHGILNNDDPMSSHLLLAPSGEGPSAEDGRLQARELLGLGLDADLVVLSGCETAKGRTGRGEGVIGLTWALFIAGVPTTVVSQWQVESESTERLMSGLHQRLAATGATAPAEALRASAVSMLTSDQYRHPFYWAGFLVVGDGLRPLR